MNREEDEKLWDLLGRSREPQVSPFFARNVVRKIREAEGEAPQRSWFSLRWLMPAAGLAVTVIAALLLRVQVPNPATTDRANQIVLAEADDDLDLLADVDDLMADDDSLVDDETVLL